MNLTIEQRQQFQLTRIFDELRVSHHRLAQVFGHDPQLFYQTLLKLRPEMELLGKLFVFRDDEYLPTPLQQEAFPCIYLNQAQVMRLAEEVRWSHHRCQQYRELLENFQEYETYRWSNLPAVPISGVIHADDTCWFEAVPAPQCHEMLEQFLGHVCGELGLSLKPEELFGLFIMKYVCPAWIKRHFDNYAQLNQLREKLLF